MTPSFRLSHLRFHLQPAQPLQLPALNKGNSLRGGFGNAFRKLVCVDLRWDCAQCTLRYQCPYTAVFNPFVPPDAPHLSHNANLPRPFVVKPPLSQQTIYPPATPLIFDLVLIGRAIEYLPYFIVAFRQLGVDGFGLNRARVDLSRVEAIALDGSPSMVYESTANLVRPSPPISFDLLSRPDTDPPLPNEAGLTIEFLTPTTLKAGSTPGHDADTVREPAFHHILKRLRDRLNALASFYGDGPLDLDFKGLGAASEQVPTVEDRTHWVERSRVARRRGITHDLSGFAGSIRFGNAASQFLPLLLAGEYVHVGKNAVFGNGWMRLHLRSEP